jgi:hypothetical protein
LFRIKEAAIEGGGVVAFHGEGGIYQITKLSQISKGGVRVAVRFLGGLN